MNNLSNVFNIAKSLVAISLLVNISMVYADDIEIFLGNKEIGEHTRPNVLFLIDDSMSMEDTFKEDIIDEAGIKKSIDRKKIDSLREAFDRVVTKAGQINIGLMLENNNSYVGIPSYNHLHKRYVQDVRYIDSPIDILRYAKEGVLDIGDNIQHPLDKSSYRTGNGAKNWRAFSEGRFFVMGWNNDPYIKFKDKNIEVTRVLDNNNTNDKNHIWYSSKDGKGNSYACSIDFLDSVSSGYPQCNSKLLIGYPEPNRYLGVHHDFGDGYTFMLFDQISIPPAVDINDAKLIIEPEDMNNIPSYFELALEGSRVAQPFIHGELIGKEWNTCFDGSPNDNIVKAKNYWLHVGQCTKPFRYYKGIKDGYMEDKHFDYKRLSNDCSGNNHEPDNIKDVRGFEQCTDEGVKKNGSGIVYKEKTIEIHFTNKLKSLLINQEAGDVIAPINAIMIRLIGRYGKHDQDNGKYKKFKFRVSSDISDGSVTNPTLKVNISSNDGSGEFHLPRWNSIVLQHVATKERANGLRLQNIRIPQYAKVKSAKIKFIAATTSNEAPIKFKICLINSGDASSFKGEGRYNRSNINNSYVPDYYGTGWNYVSPCVYWTSTQWKVRSPDWLVDISNENEDGVYYADVTSLVQNVVKREDWCGGNAIAFAIIPEDDTNRGNRVTYGYNYSRFRFNDTGRHAYDKINPDDRFEDIDLSPQLVYELERNSDYQVVDTDGNAINFNRSCSKVKFNLYPIDGEDDAYQWDDWPPSLSSGNWLSMDDYVGVRYKKVPIKQGAIIDDAAIWISDVDTGNDIKRLLKPITSYIYIDWTVNSLPFKTTKNNISKRISIDNSWNPSKWTVEPMNKRKDKELISKATCQFAYDIKQNTDFNRLKKYKKIRCSSPDLKKQLNRFFSLEGWKPGNPITLIVHTFYKEPYQPYIKSRESGLENSVELELKVSEKYIDRSIYTVRDYVIDVVNKTKADGHGPTVPFLYDVARYFTGKKDAHCVPGVSKNDNDGKNTCKDEPIKNIEGRYINWETPIKYQCQKNQIVYLSGSMPNLNNYWSRVGNFLGGECNDEGSIDGIPELNNEAVCSPSLVRWLSNNNHEPTGVGKSENTKIKLSTIGFGIKENSDTEKYLSGLAKLGGGTYYSPNNTEELVEAINSSVNVVNDENVNLTNAALSVSSSNRTQHSDQLYYSLFRPSFDQKWNGNLKRYRFFNGTIVDKYNKPAVDDKTGKFRDNAWSFWSHSIDGDETIKGGAAENMIEDRYVYTDAGNDFRKRLLNRPMINRNDVIYAPIELKQITSKLDDDLPNDLFSAKNSAEKMQLIDYLLSISFKGNNDSEKRLSDPMHAVPNIINYGKDDSKRSVIMGTNEGVVHLFNLDTGKEQSAFIAGQFLNNIRFFKDNKKLGPNNKKIYGFDNPIVVWHDEFYSKHKDGVILDKDGKRQPNETIYAYLTMRRGGNDLYALDVSDPKKPKLAWSTTNKFTPAGEYYSFLRDTWSVPVKTKIKCFDFIDPDRCLYSELDEYGNKIGKPKTRKYLDVLIFSNGYNTVNDNINGENDKRIEEEEDSGDSGGVIYIVNARNGNVLFVIGNKKRYSGCEQICDIALKDMKYSIPGRIRAVSIPKNNEDIKISDLGITNQFFATDVGGQVWRFFINENAKSKQDFIIPAGKHGVFANISGKNPNAKNSRKFYHEPDVSMGMINGERVLIVNVGSGYRAHPLNKTIEDRFYSIRTNNLNNYKSHSTIYEQDMYDATDNLIQTGNKRQKAEATKVMNDVNGSWYIKLGVGKKDEVIGKNKDGTDKINPKNGPGEKIISTPLVLDGKIYFNTYEPSVNTDNICSPRIGINRLYGINLKDGTPIKNRPKADGSMPNQPSDRVIDAGDTVCPFCGPKEIVTPDGTHVIGGIGSINAVPSKSIPANGIMYWIDKSN